MKKCTRCKETLTDEMFDSDKRMRSGLSSHCKRCISEKNLKYKRLNRERVNLQKRKYYRENRTSIILSASEYVNRNRKKKIAQHALFSAIRNGSIYKPGWCCICGATGVNIHGHHFDYERKLDVIWCCKQCHMIMHKKHYTGKEWSNG